MKGHTRKSFGDMSIKQKLFVVIIPCLSAFYGFGANIVSFQQASVARAKSQENLDNTRTVIEGWESRPIMSINLRTQCLKDETKLEFHSNIYKKDGEIDLARTLQWEGIESRCMCGYDNFNKNGRSITEPYRYEVCTTSQQGSDPRRLPGGSSSALNTKGCAVLQNYQMNKHCKPVGSNIWNCPFATKDLREEKICNKTHLDAGCSQIEEQGPETLQKWGTKQFVCIKRASISLLKLNYKDDEGKCKSGSIACGTYCYPGTECPWSSITINENSIVGEEYDSSTTDGEPIVGLFLSSGAPCDDANDDGDFGKFKSFSTAGIAVNDRGARRFALQGKSCKKTDKQWLSNGQISHKTLLAANGGNVQDFLAKDIQRKGGSFPEPQNLERNSESSSVLPADTYNKAGSNAYWKLFYRKSIPWKADCVHEKKAVSKQKDTVVSLKSAQNVLWYVQLIFGLVFFTFIFPILQVMQIFEKDQDLKCVPGEGVEEMRNLSVCRSIVKFVCYIAKLSALTVSFLAASDLNGFFGPAVKCSSDISTQKSLEGVDSIVTEIVGANRNAMFLDVAGFVFLLLGSAYKAYKGCKPDESLYADSADAEMTDIQSA